MPFVVDTVTDVTYYQNLLMGLIRTLHRRPGVKHTHLRKLLPASYSEITDWEFKQGVQMPADVRSFYSSSNGLSLEYKYSFSGDDRNNVVVGKVDINNLDDLVQVYGYETTNSSGVKFNGERYVMRLSLESKVFELVPIPNYGRVVLVYLYPKYVPTIWLLTNDSCFYYLAIDLATYVRMAIVHLGIPNWQMAYSSQGIPQWTESIFRMLAPHLLPFTRNVEMIIRDRLRRNPNDPSIPLNKVNPNIFRPTSPSNRPTISLPTRKPPTPEPEVEKEKSTKKKPSVCPCKPTPRPQSAKTQRKQSVNIK